MIDKLIGISFTDDDVIFGHKFEDEGFIAILRQWQFVVQAVENPPELFSELSSGLIPCKTISGLSVRDAGRCDLPLSSIKVNESNRAIELFVYLVIGKVKQIDLGVLGIVVVKKLVIWQSDD